MSSLCLPRFESSLIMYFQFNLPQVVTRFSPPFLWCQANDPKSTIYWTWPDLFFRVNLSFIMDKTDKDIVLQHKKKTGKYEGNRKDERVIFLHLYMSILPSFGKTT